MNRHPRSEEHPSYADIAMGYYQELPLLKAEVDDCKGAILRVEGKVERLLERVEGRPYRRDLGLEVSDTGSVRVSEVEEKLFELVQQIDIAKAEKRGAQLAVEDLEARNKKRREWIAFAFVVGGSASTALGWILHRLFH